MTSEHLPSNVNVNTSSRRRLYPDAGNDLYFAAPALNPVPSSTVAVGEVAPMYAGQPQPNLPMPLYPKASYGSLSSISFGGQGDTVGSTPADGTDSLTNSFSHLGMHSPIMSPQPPGSIVPLVGSPVQAHLISALPPIIRLSPQAACTASANCNCPTAFIRSTMNAVPNDAALLKKTRVPLALHISPFRTLEPGEPEIPVVSAATIVRCRRCRTYINPYVQFLDKGQRWKCNLCYFPNDVPESFDFDDTTHAYVDRWQRAELNHSVVEFVASSEYMLRPPQAPSFIFILDVTSAAVASGMLATTCHVLLENIDSLPNSDMRTTVAFLTVSSQVHFYKLENGCDPLMLAVGDIDEIYLPLPNDLLCNLHECKEAICDLLRRLPSIHENSDSSLFALGPAMQAATKMISDHGGKLVILAASRPNLFSGSLKTHGSKSDNPDFPDSSSFELETPFYKRFAVDSLAHQISFDFFLFATGSVSDVSLSTLAPGPRFSAGNTYYYGPCWNSAVLSDLEKFSNEFKHYIGRSIGLEAVMRVRASQGLRTSTYYGNICVRSTDLVALPTVNPDNTYAVEIAYTESLRTKVVCFQAALLHTTTFGERRIRVMTLALPVTTSPADIYHSVDIGALAALLARKAIERALEASFIDARDAIINKCADIMAGVRSTFHTGNCNAAQSLAVPESLQMLAILTLGLIKHPALRTTTSSSNASNLGNRGTVASDTAIMKLSPSGRLPERSGQIQSNDLRAFYMEIIRFVQVDSILYQLYPLFLILHTKFLGTFGDGNRHEIESEEEIDRAVFGVLQQGVLNATSERLERDGVYLIFNGVEIYIWVSRLVNPFLLKELFGQKCYSYEQVPTNGNDCEEYFYGSKCFTNVQRRMKNLIMLLRQRALRMGTIWPKMMVVREDSDYWLRSWVLSLLVEDRADHGPSYPQFLVQLRDKTG